MRRTQSVVALVATLVGCDPADRGVEDVGSTSSSSGGGEGSTGVVESSSTSDVGVSSDGSTSSAVGTTGLEPEPEPSIELGTGQLAWEPLPEGAHVELVAGLQGGWHVDVALRAAGFAPEGTVLRYEAYLAETGAPVSYETSAALTADNVVPTNEGWERVGDRVVFDIASPDAVLGAALCIVVVLEGPSFSGSDERCAVVEDEE